MGAGGVTSVTIVARLRRSIRKRGFAATGVLIVLRSLQRLVEALFAPVALVIAQVSSLRFLPVFGDRIGHLVCEPDCFLKERELGLRGARTVREVICLPSDRVANRHLASYWGAHLRVVSSPVLCRLLQPLARQKAIQYDIHPYVALIDRSATYPAIQRAWGERAPTLMLSEEDARRGRACLAELGLPGGAWFACLHVREAGYSPVDDELHAYRNFDIQLFLPALSEIRARGGWIVRLGDPSMRRLPPMDGLIDYAHSALRSDWMDVFLCAACRVFVGTSSGLCNVASVFGRPCCLAGLAPLSTVLPYGARDLGIPKLLYSLRENRHLSFAEAFASPASNFRYSELYQEAGLRVDENTPEEIAALIVEALDRLDGKATYTAEDEARQTRFKALMRPGHYSYGAPSSVGRDFLRKYERFL
jgi:putative glycosyltransferase (TIGR04372 family)